MKSSHPGRTATPLTKAQPTKRSGKERPSEIADGIRIDRWFEGIAEPPENGIISRFRRPGSQPDDSESCIVAQFTRLSELGDQEIELLQSLERDFFCAGHYPAGEVLCAAGKAEAHCFFQPQQGVGLRHSRDGRRPAPRCWKLFLAGQIMGLREIGFDRAQVRTRALTRSVCLHHFPVQPPASPSGRFFNRLRAWPICSSWFLAREHALLTERIINIGRRPAIEPPWLISCWK